LKAADGTIFGAQRGHANRIAQVLARELRWAVRSRITEKVEATAFSYRAEIMCRTVCRTYFFYFWNEDV